MKIIKIILSLLVFCVFSAQINAQTAEEIIKKHIEARGGEFLKSVHSIKLVGKLETSGRSYKLLFIKKMPDKIRFQVDMNGTPGVTVFTGDSGWIFDPSQGLYEPRKLSLAEVKQKKPLITYLMVFFDDLLLNYKNRKCKVSYIGKEKINNHTAYKILVMMQDGTIITYYIDTKTYLDYRHKVLFPDLDVVFDIELSQFVFVEGLNIPLVFESKVKDQSMTKVTIETIKINPELNDKYFSIPKF